MLFVFTKTWGKRVRIRETKRALREKEREYVFVSIFVCVKGGGDVLFVYHHEANYITLRKQ